MELNSTIKDRLNSLLADPALAKAEDEVMLTQLVDDFPYFKPVHLLLARVTQRMEDIEKATLYSNGQLCYNILHVEPATDDEVAAKAPEPTTNNPQPTTDDEVAVEAPELTTSNPQPTTDDEVAVEAPEPTTNNQQPTTDDEVAVEAPEPTTSNQQPTTEKDDQEIFEEISEFDISEFEIDLPDTQSDHNTQSAAPDTEEERQEDILHWELEDKQVNIAAAPEIETVIPDEPEHAPISKYDDDKLPYTFLWWLAKTRAEHQQIFQPYAAPKKAVSGELQQQYVEHIFHLQTGLPDNNGLLDAGTENAKPHKEDELIDAFLQNEPQIKPPPVDKLDNENKARKSAEDHNDVVSETLATIYIEQTLYRKAIDTYEKLSLKFPEKSRYFADLIKSLEKKI